MSQERHIDIFVQLPGGGSAFDGSTKLTPASTTWKVGPGGKYSRIESVAPLGRLTPLALGRPLYKHSRVRVYCDGPVLDGETVGVVGSDVSGEAFPGAATRSPPVPLTTGPDSAALLELGPYDFIQVSHAGTAGRGTLHVIIYDLDEDQLHQENLARMTADALGTLVPIPTGASYAGAVTFTADWAGERFATFTNAAAAVCTLPPTPRIGCALTYDVTGAGQLTFGGNGKNVKPDGAVEAATFVRAGASIGTGRLVYNGTKWVHISGA